MNDSFICSILLIDSLYCVTPLSIFPSNENYHISRKRKEPNIKQTKFWHLCLGHIILNRIQRLVKYTIIRKSG